MNKLIAIAFAAIVLFQATPAAEAATLSVTNAEVNRACQMGLITPREKQRIKMEQNRVSRAISKAKADRRIGIFERLEISQLQRKLQNTFNLLKRNRIRR